MATIIAKQAASLAAKKAWAGIVDKSHSENGELVSRLSNYSGKQNDGSYMLQLSRPSNPVQGIWSLVSTVGGLTGTNMSMIVIWGLDEECYISLMKSFKINGL